MKQLFFILIMGTVFSCKDVSTETKIADIDENSKEITNIKLSDTKIPSYNFGEFSHLLEKNNDTTYIINFWATWCKPCIKELPAFEMIHEEYRSEKVKVILASLDFPKQLESHVIPFIEKHQIKSEVVLLNDPDANNWIPKVDTTWTGAIPATLMYNSNKRMFYERSFSFEEIEKELIAIINQ